jgi:hypothetical protein
VEESSDAGQLIDRNLASRRGRDDVQQSAIVDGVQRRVKQFIKKC